MTQTPEQIAELIEALQDVGHIHTHPNIAIRQIATDLTTLATAVRAILERTTDDSDL